MTPKISLEDLKTYEPGSRQDLNENFVRIWSQEHQLYWRWKSAGYTKKRVDAGVWTFKAAFERVIHCCPEKQIFLEIIEPKEILLRLNPAIAKNLLSGVVNLDMWAITDGEEF